MKWKWLQKVKNFTRSWPFTIIIASVLLGCADPERLKFSRGTGDVGEFIIGEALRVGGTLKGTNTLPKLAAPWKVHQDQYGVVVRLPMESYPDLEHLLKEAFGPPKHGPTKTTDGGGVAGYRLTAKGGAILFSQELKWTEVTIIRPLTKDEFSDAIIRGFKILAEEQTKTKEK